MTITITHASFGSLFELQRRFVEINPNSSYLEIGLRSHGRGIFHKETTKGHEIGAKRVFRISEGDLLISNIFGWEGALAIASDRETGRIGSHRFMTWTPKDSATDSRYVLGYLLSKPGLALLGKASPGSAGRNRTLSIKALESIPIPLSSPEVQRSVGDRLDDAGKVAQAYGSHDLGGIVLQLREKLHSGTEVELGDILKRVSSPEPVSPENLYPFLGMRWYGEGPFVRETRSGRDVPTNRVLPVHPGAIIYNKLFAWKGSFGIVDKALEGSFVSNEFPMFHVDTDLTSAEYVLSCLKLPSFWEKVDRLSTGSTSASRNRLNESAFLEMLIPLPDHETQAEIVDRSQRLDRISTSHQRGLDIAKVLVAAARDDVFKQRE